MSIQKTALIAIVITLLQVASCDTHIDNVLAAGKACYSGLLSKVPSSFCFRNAAVAGTLPTCSFGYSRVLGLCYQKCDSGYKFTGGICVQTCSNGYSENGVLCYKFGYSSYIKQNYTADSYPNTDSRATCQTGLYKSGALCYKNCSRINLQNCGNVACTSAPEYCTANILAMSFDYVSSVSKALNSVLAFQTSGSIEKAKTEVSLRDGFQKLGGHLLKGGLDDLKAVIKRTGKTPFVRQITDFAIKNFGKYSTGRVESTTITGVCQAVSNALLDRILAADGVSLNIQSFDAASISGKISCDTEAACASAVMAAMNFVDPTGIIGMVASIKTTCSGSL